MSSSSSAVVTSDGLPDSKVTAHSSAIEVPKQYELDGIVDDDFDDSYHGHQRNTTRADQRDMSRMGKAQELKRNFRSFSALAFVIVLQGTWEVLLVGITQGLTCGGLAGVFYSYLWTFFGFGTIVLSLAEMASLAPTEGGQYHWVSEFAPARHQKWMSYFIGWISALSWQAGQASGPFLVGTTIQGVISLNNPDYSPTNWQGTLLVWAVVLAIYVLNVWGNDAMPMLNNVFLVIHVFGFFAIVLTLWLLSPRNTAEITFTQFTNEGGWSSMGLALMVGQLSAIYALICSDSAAHISEEVKDAGKTVPRTMVYSYLINAMLGLVMLITFLFMITDLDGALTDTTGYPILWVFRNTVSLGGQNALSVVLLIMVFAGTISFNISTSRQTWSFARDNGLPYSKWIAHVDEKKQLPVNAIFLTCCFTCLMALINIGSDVAFGAIVSLNLVSLMLSYMTSIGCILWRRIVLPNTLPKARWSLGKFGVFVNVTAILYSTFAFFWCFWPNSFQPDEADFNWAIVMFMALVIWSVVYYFIKGRKVYSGPVVLTEAWRSR
ncbi:hypothetical protein MMC25_005410 [Agyrium rufum]|nr:hypothetical protein [Agyrium rufum]